MSFPLERLMERLAVAAGEAAADGMTFSDTAAATLQLGIQMMIRQLGNEGAVIMLRRVADGLDSPEPASIPDLISMKPKGSA